MWILKILLKLFLTRFNLPYKLWRKIKIFKHGKMQNINYAQSIFEKHFTKFNKFNKKTIIMELGPGDSLFTGIFGWLNDCETILIDSRKFAETDIHKYLKQFDRDELIYKNLESLNANEWLESIGCKYMTDGLKSIKKVENESVDFIFSQAVLEHIYKEEFDSYVDQMYRVLKVGGLTSHRIDFKDHLDSSLNNLRFPEKIWETKLFRTSGFYTNRYRSNQIINIFEKKGFKVIIKNTDFFPKLPIPKSKFTEKFRDLDEKELMISGIDILCYKLNDCSFT